MLRRILQQAGESAASPAAAASWASAAAPAPGGPLADPAAASSSGSADLTVAGIVFISIGIAALLAALSVGVVLSSRLLHMAEARGEGRASRKRELAQAPPKPTILPVVILDPDGCVGMAMPDASSDETARAATEAQPENADASARSQHQGNSASGANPISSGVHRSQRGRCHVPFVVGAV